MKMELIEFKLLRLNCYLLVWPAQFFFFIYPHFLNTCLLTQITWFMTCTFWVKGKGYGDTCMLEQPHWFSWKHALIAYAYVIRWLRPRTCMLWFSNCVDITGGIFSLLSPSDPSRGWGGRHLDSQQVGGGVQNRTILIGCTWKKMWSAATDLSKDLVLWCPSSHVRPSFGSMH